MKTLKENNKVNIALCYIIIFTVISSCAVKKDLGKMNKQGIQMAYQNPLNTELVYETISDANETALVMDKNYEMLAKSKLKFSLSNYGEKENDLRLSVTIDDFSQEINIADKSINPDMSTVIGKQFDITMSEKGNHVDVSEAENIKYELAPGNKRAMASSFQAFFPKLPDYSIKQGKTWHSADTITERSKKGFVRITIDNTNKFESFETINDMECMKISVNFHGNIQGSTEKEGALLHTTGTIKGRGTWYFAYKEGLLVQTISEGEAETKTEVQGDESIDISGKRIFTTKAELLN